MHQPLDPYLTDATYKDGQLKFSYDYGYARVVSTVARAGVKDGRGHVFTDAELQGVASDFTSAIAARPPLAEAVTELTEEVDVFSTPLLEPRTPPNNRAQRRREAVKRRKEQQYEESGFFIR